MYDAVHTSFDVMKEFMITGAELDGKYQIPVVPACRFDYMPEDCVDFGESFNRGIKNTKKLNCNFYIDDTKFTRLWNNPDKYLEHLKCFHSVTMPDFSIATGAKGMPFVLNLYNKYRNHALGWYMHLNGLKVIPSVSIADKESYEWCFDGLPKNSILSVSTNGRVRSKASRLEFCEGFRAMCERLEPAKVIIVGRMPDELNTDVKIINFQSRNQKVNERLANGNYDK